MQPLSSSFRVSLLLVLGLFLCVMPQPHLAAHNTKSVANTLVHDQKSIAAMAGDKSDVIRNVGNTVFRSLSLLSPRFQLTPTAEPGCLRRNENIHRILNWLEEQPNGRTTGIDISGDGRYVALVSNAANLLYPPGGSGLYNAFIYNRQWCDLERIPYVAGNNDTASELALSGDGSVIAFASLASDLVSNDTNNVKDIFFSDHAYNALERVSVDSNGNQANNVSSHPAVSYDGRYIAFQTLASNLDPGDTNGRYDIYVYDRYSRKVRWVSAGINDVPGNGDSYDPTIIEYTLDEYLVAFSSAASNLVPGDTNGVRDIFIYDSGADQMYRITLDPTGSQVWGASENPEFEIEGDYLVFQSSANTLVAGDTNNASDIFIWVRNSGKIYPISINNNREFGNGPSYRPGISRYGHVIAFISYANNLVPGDTNNTADLFVRDWWNDKTYRVAEGVNPDASLNWDVNTAISDDGKLVAFVSNNAGLVPNDTNGYADAFVARVPEVFGPLPTATYTPSPTLTYTPSPTSTWTLTPTWTLSPTWTITPTKTPTLTMTPTWTPRPTSTPTQTLDTQFRCEQVTVNNLRISGTAVNIAITNNNPLATYLTGIYFPWRRLDEYGYDNLYLAAMALNGSTIWQGRDFHAPTDTSSADPEDQSLPPFLPFAQTDEGDRTLTGSATTTWGALFSNGPVRLEDYTIIYDYAGTTFTLYNPSDPAQPCTITLNLPTPTPSPTFDPNAPTATSTAMPDCDVSHLLVRFVRFETYGIVRLEVVNNRNTVAPLTGFNLQWKKAISGTISLTKVTVAASYNMPGSVLVWQAKTSQDKEPPTTSTDAIEGTWLTNYSFSPNSITPLFLDFDGTNDMLDRKGIYPSDFNGSQFNIGCIVPGGSSTQPIGITLQAMPTPIPSRTPGPSNTPGPTKTPSKTPTPAPYTWTPTPRPVTPTPTQTPSPTIRPTQTLRPSITPTKTPSNTPTPVPTWTPAELFQCERLTAQMPYVAGTTVALDLHNDNELATYLTGVNFQWRQLDSYPNLHVSAMALNGATLWQGQDFHAPTDTASVDPEDQSQPPFAQTDVNARTVDGHTTLRWATSFTDGPARLQDYTSIYDYSGTTFTVYNPSDPANPCIIRVNLPTPTPTFDPNAPSLTPTATPDCEGKVEVRFGYFDPFGAVGLYFFNNSPVPVTLNGFTIEWKKSPAAQLQLFRVTVQALTYIPGSTTIWAARSSQDYEPPTTSSDTTEGFWLSNSYTFKPQSALPILIDFSGTTNSLNQIGITPSDFNGTRFNISCGGQAKEVVLIYPEQPATATFTPTMRPPTQTPTPLPTFDFPTNTPTPACGSDHLRARLVGFEPYGLVRLEIKNNGNQLLGLFDFTVEWQQPASGTINLARVNGTASQGLPDSVLLWEAQSGQDSEPPTTGSNPSEGQWKQNYVISPQTTVPLYLDFDGTTGSLDQLGLTLSDFADSRLTLMCDTQVVELSLDNPINPPIPTQPAASLTPSPSITMTRQPSLTPSRTPTKTPTRMPTLTPSQTFTPSRTPTRIPTITPTPRPTQPPDAVPTLNYSTGDIVLSWGRVPWAVQYYVQLDTDTEFNIPYTTYFTPNGDTLQWRVTGLKPGVYFWRVSAINNLYQTGPWSLIGSFVVGPQ